MSASRKGEMVEHYAFCSTAAEIRERFRTSGGCFRAWRLINAGTRWRIAPLQPVVVVTQRADGSRELRPMQWGLVPGWEPDPRRAAGRACAPEEVAPTNLLWRNAFHRRRCLIPATAFYPQSEAGSERPPAAIYRKDDRLFAFAGIWEEWHAPSGASLRSCAILTTTANPLVARFSDRMPVILQMEVEAAWLDATLKGAALRNLLGPCPEEELEARPVPPEFHRSGATSPLPDLLTRISPDW